MKNIYQQVSDLLSELPSALAEAGLWSAAPPTSQALKSSLPFCCDTMHFHDWLQFVFQPKMRVIIENKLPLPDSIALLPMGEESWKGKSKVKWPLQVLSRIDQLLNAHG